MPLLNAGRVELLDVPTLRTQLLGLERRSARSGKDSIDHAPRKRDDVVNAVAGVLVTLDQRSRRDASPLAIIRVGDVERGRSRDYAEVVGMPCWRKRTTGGDAQPNAKRRGRCDRRNPRRDAIRTRP